MFSICSHLGGGGRNTLARSGWAGGGGVPHSQARTGGYYSQVRTGDTTARSGRGYHGQVRMGGALVRSGRGVPWPGQDRGCPGQVRTGRCPGQVRTGRCPGQVRTWGNLARSGWGVPWPAMQYSPVWGNLYQGWGTPPPASIDRVSPHPGMGWHPQEVYRLQCILSIACCVRGGVGEVTYVLLLARGRGVLVPTKVPLLPLARPGHGYHQRQGLGIGSRVSPPPQVNWRTKWKHYLPSYFVRGR